MSFKITRNVDELGRVVLPVQYRNALGLQDKDSIDMCLNDAKNTITLYKTVPSCCICNTADSLIQISGKYVCDHCKERLASADVGDCIY